MLKQPERYSARSKDNWQARLSRLLPHALLVLLLVVAANLLLRYLWVHPVRMSSKSMEPTIPAHSLFFVQEQSIDAVSHRQVVQVDHPLGGRLYCRVVAVEGETVELTNGNLFVAGKPFSISGVTSPQPIFPAGMSHRDNLSSALTIRPGFFFCLNDNRAYLNDSRTFGPFELRHITGRVRYHRWLGSKI